MKKLLYLFISATFLSCTNSPSNPLTPPDNPNNSSEKLITTFNLKNTDNQGILNTDITGTITTDSIHLLVPAGTNVTNLKPSITIKGKSVYPASLTAQNFIDPVEYTVTAEDGSIKKYVVVVAIAAIDATIFIGGQDFNSKGHLYAIDANTGNTKWISAASGIMFGSPAYANGTVYYGAEDGYFYALDANSGTEKWKYKTNDIINCTPTVVNDIVYFHSYDQYLYALNASSGSLIWKFKQSFSTDVVNFSNPTVVDGVLYIGCYNGFVYALNASTGSVNWSYNTNNGAPDYSLSSPAVVNGTLHIGDGRNNVLALNTSDGSLKWNFNSMSVLKGAEFYPSPTIENQTLYICSSATDNTVYALDINTGTLKWQYVTAQQITASPIVAFNLLYIGNRSGQGANFYALDTQTGIPVWTHYSTNEYTNSATVFNDNVYAGSFSKLFCFDAKTGDIKWTFETPNIGSREGFFSSACIVDANGNTYQSGVSGEQQ